MFSGYGSHIPPIQGQLSVTGKTMCTSTGYPHSGSVVECPLCDREVVGSIPSLVIPKTLKMVLDALSLGAQH